ncbi:MAG: hypothetical protein V1779_11205 [bacterium]
MEQISLSIKDDSKTKFLIDLLKQLDFVEFTIEKKDVKKKYNFFKSAGLWKNRNIDGETLRKQAWKLS